MRQELHRAMNTRMEHRRHWPLFARRSLLVAALGGVLVALANPFWGNPVAQVLVGWNAASLIWLLAVGWLIGHAGPQDVRHHAAELDPSWMISLGMAIAALTASVGAIFFLLAGVKGLPGGGRLPHALAAMVTIATAWVSLHTLYALHYAHLYYAHSGDRTPGSGIDFPGTRQPTFGDSFYFSFTIGATSQTSDVAITASRVRKSVLIHACLSFAFNTTLLALTINLAAALF